MSNVITKSSDGVFSVDSAALSKYSHYQYVRFYSIGNGPVFVKAILQGWNGKKWVRAKAKLTKEEQE